METQITARCSRSKLGEAAREKRKDSVRVMILTLARRHLGSSLDTTAYDRPINGYGAPIRLVFLTDCGMLYLLTYLFDSPSKL